MKQAFPWQKRGKRNLIKFCIEFPFCSQLCSRFSIPLACANDVHVNAISYADQVFTQLDDIYGV